MDNYQGPVSLCEAWLEKRVKTMSPRSLVEISLRKIVMMIKLYPNSSMEANITVSERTLKTVEYNFQKEIKPCHLKKIKIIMILCHGKFF